MRVLVACEESQVVCKAFRERGHEAYSCDLLPTSGANPEWHIHQDVTHVMTRPWDMIIAFPPCTNLSVSGARWFKDKKASGEQQKSIDFFMRFVEWGLVFEKPLAIENPIGIMSTYHRKPDQIIQPWQFGHGETKSTCLWLNGLPKLVPTEIVEGREQRIFKMAPSATRSTDRSKTFEGIARAMAEQWG